jgi:hypothetical protein
MPLRKGRVIAARVTWPVYRRLEREAKESGKTVFQVFVAYVEEGVKLQEERHAVTQRR